MSIEEMESAMNVGVLGILVLWVTVVITLLQGIIIAIVRSNEPIYKHLVFTEIMSWFGEVTLDVNYKSKNGLKMSVSS